MHKIRKCLLACTILISTVISAATALSLDKKMIDAINDHISNASSRCDFEESQNTILERLNSLITALLMAKRLFKSKVTMKQCLFLRTRWMHAMSLLLKKKQYPRSLK